MLDEREGLRATRNSGDHSHWALGNDRRVGARRRWLASAYGAYAYSVHCATFCSMLYGTYEREGEATTSVCSAWTASHRIASTVGL